MDNRDIYERNIDSCFDDIQSAVSEIFARRFQISAKDNDSSDRVVAGAGAGAAVGAIAANAQADRLLHKSAELLGLMSKIMKICLDYNSAIRKYNESRRETRQSRHKHRRVSNRRHIRSCRDVSEGLISSGHDTCDGNSGSNSTDQDELEF